MNSSSYIDWQCLHAPGCSAYKLLAPMPTEQSKNKEESCQFLSCYQEVKTGNACQSNLLFFLNTSYVSAAGKLNFVGQ